MEQLKYTSKWFRVAGGPRERFVCRYPTVDEKYAHITAETIASGAGGKPGDQQATFSGVVRAMVAHTVPLIETWEREESEPGDVSALVESAAHIDVIFQIGNHLFRPASFEGD